MLLADLVHQLCCPTRACLHFVRSATAAGSSLRQCRGALWKHAAGVRSRNLGYGVRRTKEEEDDHDEASTEAM